MKGLFCRGCKAKNNEEYRLVLKRRQKRVYFIIAAGILTVVLSLISFAALTKMTDDIRLSTLTGIGTGLVAGGVFTVLRLRWILADENRLKKQRLRETDEREVEAGNQALKATAKLMLVLFYILMIWGIVVSEEVLNMCSLLICFFLLSYMIFLRYYRKIM